MPSSQTAERVAVFQLTPAIEWLEEDYAVQLRQRALADQIEAAIAISPIRELTDETWDTLAANSAKNELRISEMDEVVRRRAREKLPEREAA